MRYLLVLFMIFLVLALTRSAGMVRGVYGRVDLIVARADLPPGTPLGPDVITIKGFPRRNVRKGSFEVHDPSDIRAVDGLETMVPFPKDTPFLRNRLMRTADKAEKKGGTPPVLPDFRELLEDHYMKGYRYYEKGEYDKARDEWELARKQDPASTAARAGLKQVRRKLAGEK